MVLKRSWPAVSQIWSLMVFPSTSIVLIFYSGEWLVLLFYAYKVNTNSGHEVISENVVLYDFIITFVDYYSESQEERWFTDTGVSNKEHFEEIVAKKIIMDIGSPTIQGS